MNQIKTDALKSDESFNLIQSWFRQNRWAIIWTWIQRVWAFVHL